MFEGFKISPLPFDVQKPIKYWNQYTEPLSKRRPLGFGGVSEYGITSRWDKNNLNIIRLILERRNSFSLYGGMRYGSNLTADQIFELGFDHLALCLGAGHPKAPEIPI
jgi:NADPH-dependent glutamate synthase beta subunit-like oxidoreductase